MSATLNLELSDAERTTLSHALQVYLSDLREEIVKTEKREWKEGLHNEKDMLQRVLERIS